MDREKRTPSPPDAYTHIYKIKVAKHLLINLGVGRDIGGTFYFYFPVV